MGREGALYIISAPSGAGKSTLFKMTLDNFKDLHPSISYTTRTMRDGEREGVDYFFVSDDKFNEMIKENKFVEWANVHNHKYGTSRDFIENYIKKGKDLLFDIDVQGARSLKKIFPNAVLIFILTPTLKVLQDRLTQRMTNATQDINIRMKNAIDEIKEVNIFDYLVINGVLETAFNDIKSIIITNRLARQRKEFNFNNFIKI